MPQILIRDMRRFGDGLMRAKMFVDQVVVWISEDRDLMTALADANMQIRQRDTAIRLTIDVLMDVRQPEGEWFREFSSRVKEFTRGAEPMIETGDVTRYTWDMHNARGEQFSIEFVFRGATDGDSTDTDGTDPEPTEIQDDPDGVGGGSRDIE